MNKAFFTLLFLALNLIGFSQSKTSFGVKGGFNVSTVTNAELNSKTNFYLGALLNIHINSLYEIQPEITYSNQGGKYKNDGKVSLEYISISVANKFFVTKDQKFHLLIAPGIDLDIDDTFIGIINRNNDSGNDATFIDFSITAGLGYELKNGITIEARYKRGFIDVYSGSFHNFESDRYENEYQFNSVFQLGLTYKFNFSKKEE